VQHDVPPCICRMKPLKVTSWLQVMPYSTGCTTTLSNFEAGQNYKDVDDPAVTVSHQHCNRMQGPSDMSESPDGLTDRTDAHRPCSHLLDVGFRPNTADRPW